MYHMGIIFELRYSVPVHIGNLGFYIPWYKMPWLRSSFMFQNFDFSLYLATVCTPFSFVLKRLVGWVGDCGV